MLMLLPLFLFIRFFVQGSAPIIYRPEYAPPVLRSFEQQIYACDGMTSRTVAEYLAERYRALTFYVPDPVSDDDLAKVHSRTYLTSLAQTSVIRRIAELPAVSRTIPYFVLRRAILDPMRYVVGGTIQAGECARIHGWSIQLGGGYVQARKDEGSAGDFFADIPLAVALLRSTYPDMTILVIDLDAFPAQGVATYVQEDQKLWLFDLYASAHACSTVSCSRVIRVQVPAWVTDSQYERVLKEQLPRMLDLCMPDLVFYHAGLSVLAQDTHGKMRISSTGLSWRDAYVCGELFARNIPCALIISEGTCPEAGRAAARSVDHVIRTHELIASDMHMKKARAMKQKGNKHG